MSGATSAAGEGNESHNQPRILGDASDGGTKLLLGKQQGSERKTRHSSEFARAMQKIYKFKKNKPLFQGSLLLSLLPLFDFSISRALQGLNGSKKTLTSVFWLFLSYLFFNSSSGKGNHRGLRWTTKPGEKITTPARV